MGGLRKIPIEGGEPTDLFTLNVDAIPAISPDGKYIAFLTSDYKIGIVPSADPNTEPFLDMLI